MDAFRDSNNYSIPIYFKDQANDLKNIEAEAKRALQNIKSLYEEIMHTDSHDNFESENNVVSSGSPSTSSTDKQQCTASINRFAETSRKFYFHSQLPLTHCFDCHERYYDTDNITSRSISTEEKFNCESEIHHSKENNVQNSKSSNSTLKITKPHPFKFSGFDKQWLEAKQRKLAKLKEEKEQQIEKELNVKVVSKPVPKHTHLPLYKDMVIKNEKRKIERKEESLKVIGRASKPSPLSDASQTSITLKALPSEELKSSFKATPVPKHILSSKVSEKLKSKEEIRKMLSAHRAEEMLKQSSSPLSKKTISRSYSMLDLNEYKKDEEKDKKSKPNITAITNRLYTKKCKETLNNWNDKVTRYCYKENQSQSNITIFNKLKPQPEQTYPFLYYPVRMSTAASLRDKQIRSEILARETREKHKNNKISETQQEMHEEISKRLQKLIPDIDPDKEIEDKVKSFRESQMNREEEYEHELEEIMKRVSQQYLLVERQSKKEKKRTDSIKGVTYEEEYASVLNSDTDTKSDHLEEKESVSESEDSENSE